MKKGPDSAYEKRNMHVVHVTQISYSKVIDITNWLNTKTKQKKRKYGTKNRIIEDTRIYSNIYIVSLYIK